MITVFIENERGSTTQNVFDADTLEQIESGELSAAFPFAQGFVMPEDMPEDGDPFDSVVLTKKRLKTRRLVEVDPIGVLTWEMDGETHDLLLTILPEEDADLTPDAKDQLRNFLNETHPLFHMDSSEFHGKRAALDLLDIMITS